VRYRAYRAIKDPYTVQGLSPGWTIEGKRWYGWVYVDRHYGDEQSATTFIGNLVCPQIITARVPPASASPAPGSGGP
jgi:hypothetical protein